MGIKPSLPKGTRDFGPEIVRKRKYIFDSIREIFELYGYQPLETPAMEQLDTLIGKYGEEGDKLIFKILNNGLGDPKNIDKARAAFENVLNGKNDPNLTERALRYDLTIPFARFVAMNHNELTLPFRRYQMQPVWRADKPQKSRYREFYQCDADVVGSNSLINEVELASIYQTAFQKFRIPVEVRINHRKILAALAEICDGTDKMTAITVTIDKIDKIGIENVKAELVERGLNDTQVTTIAQYLAINGPNDTKLSALKTLFVANPTGQEGIADLEYILGFNPTLSVDLTLARGLNYYTGTIFEVKAESVKVGSIGGGGRYDDLTNAFGVPNIPGVGISFGVDRIYDVMEELRLFPDMIMMGTQVLFFNLGQEEEKKSFLTLQRLRNLGIRGEIYNEKTKLEKQFKYAERRKIPYTIIIGQEEIQKNTCKIKDQSTGIETTISLDLIELYPFTKEIEEREATILTESSLISSIIQKNETVKFKKKNGQILRGRSEALNTYIENRFAQYLSQKIDPSFQILVDFNHKIAHAPIHFNPDISIVRNDEILAFIEFKINSGHSRSLRKDFSLYTSRLDKSKIDGVEINISNDRSRSYRVNPKTKYHFITLSNRSISATALQKIHSIDNINFEFYILTENFYPNSNKLDYLSKMSINHSAFKDLITNLNKLT